VRTERIKWLRTPCVEFFSWLARQNTRPERHREGGTRAVRTLSSKASSKAKSSSISSAA
jgi:hypothetical protein